MAGIKFTGILEGEKVTFELDGMGRLVMTNADGTEELYNEEYYDNDQYGTIREALLRDGVRELMDAE